MERILICLLSLLCYVHGQWNHIPLTLARGQFSAVSIGQINYFAVKLCEDSCANNKWATLTITLPSNPAWTPTDPLVALELSMCKYSFDETCVFSTNYVWTNNTFFAEVSWNWPRYLDTSGSFYIRVTPLKASVAYSFQVQFESIASPTAGQFDFDAFKQTTVPTTTTFNQLKQYVSSPQTYEVRNYNMNEFFVKFCTDDFPQNCRCRDNFTIIASITASAEKPMSLFELYACSANYSDCSPYNYEVADEGVSSVAQLEVTNNDQANITDGMYLIVVGNGGETDMTNEYYLDINLYL